VTVFPYLQETLFDAIQPKLERKRGKVTIVGAGAVGLAVRLRIGDLCCFPKELIGMLLFFLLSFCSFIAVCLFNHPAGYCV
jgi:hypothetical protein